MKILVAEDDTDSRRILMVNLTGGGHEVVEAEDGEQAWRIWERDHIRLVITDWMMPNLSGPDLIRRLRSASYPYYTYIIMLTALGRKPLVVEGLEAGADEYLTKPFYTEELLERVKIGERILKLEDRLNDEKRQIEHQAMHDSLSGLLNRGAIQKRAEAELSRCARESKSMGLAMLDIDHFKAINDQHGHQIGDQVLRLVARILAQNIRAYDSIGRWGGEEFLVVLPGAALEDARLIAERIRMCISEAHVPLPGGEAMELRGSLGVTSSPIAPAASLKLESLLQQADEALYRAKSGGRNQVCSYEKIEA